MRPTILAACLLIAWPAVAQDPEGGDNEIQQRRPMSDHVPGTPEGDLLTKPAQGPVPADAPRQPAVPAGEDAATNARSLTTEQTLPGEREEGGATAEEAARGDGEVEVMRTTPPPDRSREDGPPPERRSSAMEAEPPRHAEQFRGDRPIGPNAGSATQPGQVYAEDLKDYTVHLSDREKFGRVERVLVDLESGRLQAIEVSTGGLLGVGDQRFDIPWEAVAAVNTGTKELRVAVSEQQIQGQKEAFDRPAGDRQ